MENTILTKIASAFKLLEVDDITLSSNPLEVKIW